MARNYRVNQVRESALDRLLNQTIPQHLSDKRNDEKYKEEISYRRERDANADTLALEERDYRRGQEDLRLDKVARQDGLTLGSSFAVASANYAASGDFVSADSNNEKLKLLVENNPHINMTDFASLDPNVLLDGINSQKLYEKSTNPLKGNLDEYTHSELQTFYEDGLANTRKMTESHRTAWHSAWADAYKTNFNLEFISSAGKDPQQIADVNAGFSILRTTMGQVNLSSVDRKDITDTAKQIVYEKYLTKLNTQKDSGSTVVNALTALDKESSWDAIKGEEKEKTIASVYRQKYGKRDTQLSKEANQTFLRAFNRPDEVNDFYKSSASEDSKIDLYNQVRYATHMGLEISEVIKDKKGNITSYPLDEKMLSYGFPESYISGAAQRKLNKETGGGGGSGDLKTIIPLSSDQVARVEENIVTIKKNVSKDNFKESLTDAKSSLLEQDPNMEYHNPIIHKIKFDKDGPYILGKDIDLDRYNTKSLGTPNINDLRLRNYQNQVDTGRDSDGFKLTPRQIEKAKNVVKRLQNKAPQFTQMSPSVNSIDNPLSIQSPEYQKVLEELNFKNTNSVVSISPESPFYEMLASENQKKRGRKLSLYKTDVVQKILKSRGDEKYRVTSRFLNEVGLN